VAVASAGPYANHLHLIPTDNHASTSSLSFLFTMLFLTPSQQHQSTEGNILPYCDRRKKKNYGSQNATKFWQLIYE